MRRLAPLTLAFALVLAAPAAAADVEVVDFDFMPGTTQIAVGDSVRWTFTNGGHTTTSSRGQPDRWDSGTRGAGETFEKTFATPGRYEYVCRPHASFMRGVVQVGEDEVADTVDALRARRRGATVRISFRLNEPARVEYALRGPVRRRVSRGRLEAGRHSFALRRLEAGRYRGVLTVVDDFDKRSRARNSFTT
jgi:plastocyanin